MKVAPIAQALLIAFAVINLSACNKKESANAQGGAMTAPTVDVHIVELGNSDSFSGRVTAAETSEVRPQVSGIIDEILFQEGSIVEAGQPLYHINADSYSNVVAADEAALGQALANVDTAQTNLLSQEAIYEQTKADLARLQGLLEAEAISKQAYDQAITNLKTAEAGIKQAEANLASSKASVKTAKANLSTSRLDLNRTIVRAPISGKTSISAVRKGALVSAGQTSPLVTISRISPIYIDIKQSSEDILKLRQKLGTGWADTDNIQVQLVLEDGTTYPMTGELTLSNVMIDENTGSMVLRAIFDNSQGILIPGMFVSVRLNQSILPNATLLPKSAVTLNPQGKTQVYVVNTDNKIEARAIDSTGTKEGNWIITSGLKTGDKVVVLGGSHVKPKDSVTVRVLPNTPSSTKPSQSPKELPKAQKAKPEQLSSEQAKALAATD